MNGPLLLFLTIIIGFILWLFVVDILFPSKSGSCAKKREGLENAGLYSATINDLRQIYENLYFDIRNGNVLDITISEKTTTTKGTDGKDVTTTTKTTEINMIYGRDKGNKVDVSKYIVSGDSVVSATASADTISSSYDQFSFTTADKVNVFYICWDTETYIHVIDLEKSVGEGNSTSPQNVVTFAYDKTGSAGSIKTSPFTDSIISLNTQSYTMNITDNRMQFVPLYDYSKSLYKIVDKVFYDVTNGGLITQEPNGINIYERKTQSASGCATPTPIYLALEKTEARSGTSTAIVDVGFCTWVLQFNNFLVVYIGNGKKTIIAVLNMQTNSKEYSFVNTVRYLSNGTVDNGTSINHLEKRGAGDFQYNVNNIDMETQILMQMFGGYDAFNQLGMGGQPGMGPDMGGKSSNPLSDYYKWVEYWNNTAGTDLYSKRPGSEYVLKSQIVPPVCPRCPSCPKSGVCNTCGGNGGSGTQGAPATEGAGSSPASNGVTGFLKDTGSGVKDFVEDAGSEAKEIGYDIAEGTQEVVGDVYGEAKDVAGDIVGGAKDVAGEVVGGTKDVVGDVYGEAKDVVGDVYGEAKGIIGGALGGVKGLFGSSPTNVGAINTGYGRGAGAGGVGAGGVGAGAGGVGGVGGQRFGVYSNAPQTQGSDHMTYFGALQPKGDSNYIPVTADFSAFRK